MLSIHSGVRLFVPCALGAAAFWLQELAATALIYAFALAGLIAARQMRVHALFLASTLPLLAALLLIWGWAINPGGLQGAERAVRLWIRICIVGAGVQWMIMPLVQEPLHLRAFFEDVRLPRWVSLLFITPILFLPEIRRRIGAIVDARRAQGLPTSGLSGARALPSMIVPLVASLLEASLGRAELWSHRDLLASDYSLSSARLRSTPLSLGVLIVSVLGIGLALWI